MDNEKFKSCDPFGHKCRKVSLRSEQCRTDLLHCMTDTQVTFRGDDSCADLSTDIVLSSSQAFQFKGKAFTTSRSMLSSKLLVPERQSAGQRRST